MSNEIRNAGSFQRVEPEHKTRARLWMERFWLGRAFFYFADIKFVRFLMVAGLNTVFGVVVFALLRMTGIPRNLAAALGYIIGIIFNFKTYGTIVFKNGKYSLLPRFILVYIIMYLTSIGGMKLLVDNWLGAVMALRIANPVAASKWADNAASAIMCIPVGFLGFFLNKIFVFEHGKAGGAKAGVADEAGGAKAGETGEVGGAKAGETGEADEAEIR